MMSIRPLSSALQKKAECEVNEVPSRILEDLQHIKDWLAKQPHLKARTDDQWLLTFLRGCKFSLERTKEKLDLFYALRSLLPEYSSNRDPLLPEIQEILQHGLVTVLPKTADPAGPAIFWIQHDPAISEKLDFVTHMKVFTMVIDILMIENDNFTIAGQHVVIDFRHISYKYIIQMTPSVLSKILLCLQAGYPTRPQGLHLMYAPSVFDTVYKIMRKFLTGKLRNRVTFYTDSNINALYENIPLKILPKEFGGEEVSLDEIAANWKSKLESYRDWFLEDATYGTDETKRPGKPLTSASLFGVEGSFRNLKID